MLEKLTDVPPGVDGVEGLGRVTRRDYEEVVEPLVAARHEQNRKIRFLYWLGPRFKSFSAGAICADFRFGMRYLRDFERVAVVSDIGWIRRMVGLFGALMRFPVAVFPNGEYGKAAHWLALPSTDTQLHIELKPEIAVLILEPNGPLRRDDFERAAAAISSWLAEHGALRGIVIHSRHFPGWKTFAAFRRHLRFIHRELSTAPRVAIATDSRLAKVTLFMARLIVRPDVKLYPYASFPQALRWASGDDPE